MRQKTPRPLNCFMIFRLEKQREIAARCPGANHRDISKIIAKWWTEAPEQEKLLYREKARIAKAQHAKDYPDYRYSPQKKTGRRRYTIRTADALSSNSNPSNQLLQRLYSDRNALGTASCITDAPTTEQPIRCSPPTAHFNVDRPSQPPTMSEQYVHNTHIQPCNDIPYPETAEFYLLQPADKMQQTIDSLNPLRTALNDPVFTNDLWYEFDPFYCNLEPSLSYAQDTLPMSAESTTSFPSFYVPLY